MGAVSLNYAKLIKVNSDFIVMILRRPVKISRYSIGSMLRSSLPS